jgi:hypothetical protein
MTSSSPFSPVAARRPARGAVDAIGPDAGRRRLGAFSPNTVSVPDPGGF